VANSSIYYSFQAKNQQSFNQYQKFIINYFAQGTVVKIYKKFRTFAALKFYIRKYCPMEKGKLTKCTNIQPLGGLLISELTLFLRHLMPGIIIS